MHLGKKVRILTLESSDCAEVTENTNTVAKHIPFISQAIPVKSGNVMKNLESKYF